MKYIAIEGVVYSLTEKDYSVIREKIDSCNSSNKDLFHECLDEIREKGKEVRRLDEIFNY